MKPVVLAKVNYFFFFMAWGASVPFLAPHLDRVCHFSSRQIGLLLMIAPLISLIAQPLWSSFADRTRQRTLITAFLTLAVAFIYPLGALGTSFWYLIPFFVVYALVSAPLVSLGDAITFDALGENEKAHFPSVRIWGTFGFLVATLILGSVFDRFGSRWLFVFFGCSMSIAACAVFVMPRSAAKHHTEPVKMRMVYADKRLVIFIIMMLGIFAANQMALTFLGVYAEKLGASQKGIGIIWMVSTVFEALLMPFARKIINALGVKKTIALGMIMVAVRCFPMAFVDHWWVLALLSVMNCAMFVFCYVGGVTFVDTIAPLHMRATAQGFFGMAVINGSLIVGNLLAGELLTRWGFKVLYLSSSVFALITVGLFVLLVKEPSSPSPGGEGAGG